MNKWILRAALIGVVAGLVAALLPGIRQRREVAACREAGAVYDYGTRLCRSDVQSLPPGSVSVIQLPEKGSLLVGAVVAIALLRVFVTLDRRARSRLP